MLHRTHWLAGVAAAALLLGAGASHAQFSLGVSVRLAPPPLPFYEQPPLPASGYLWVPGYWAWDEGGYYWVPGVWVLPPRPGLLWTPGYWAWQDGAYFWHEGYWAPQVGFYGGVDYGYGYDGSGYLGGYWSRGVFFYNDACNRLPAGRRFQHVYHRPVQHIRPGHLGFNGPGGTNARPTERERALQREPHVRAVAAQRDEALRAQRRPGQRAGGQPPPQQHQTTPRSGAREGAGAQNSYRYIPERAPQRAGPGEPGRAPHGPLVIRRPDRGMQPPTRAAPPAQGAPQNRGAPQSRGAPPAHRPAKADERGDREPPH